MGLMIRLSIVLFWAAGAYAQMAADRPGLSTISGDDLMETVRYLASEELGGRLSGSEGYNKAARYAADRFRKLGLKPMGDDEYYQNLKVEYNEIHKPLRFNLIENGTVRKAYEPGRDFVCRGLSPSGHVTAEVVFCGYGISMPALGYDDYEGVDVKGKIVMVFKPNPGWKMNDSADWGNGYPRSKARIAKKHGAAGMLIVSPPNDVKPQRPIISILEGGGEQDNEFPQLHIDIPVADELLAGNGLTLKSLQSKIDSSRRPFSLSPGSTAEIEVNSVYSKEKPTMNIIGLLEGSDSTYKNEYLVIGAHLDHVGSQASLIYAPGANDNASGSAAVLEIAEAFLKGNLRPKRSVVFVLFASEELGLTGSQYFVDHSPMPLEKITAMINLDCVGYGDSIQVGNGKSSPELWRIAYHNDSLHTKSMVKATWGGGGADAGPFHGKGIPAAYFVTTNSYAHLHCTTDKPETLNEELFEKVVKLAYLSAVRIADGDYLREEIVR